MWVNGRTLAEVVLKFTLAQVKRNSKMRMITSILVAFVASGPASAQSWNEYAYPTYSFAISFPADPKIEITTYQAADDRAVEAHVYSVAQDDAVFKMTIIDFSDAAMEENAVIDHAIKALSREGDIKVNLPARINRVYGRQLSIVGTDGSHSSVAVFYLKGRLYQIEGKALPKGNEAASYAIRFQQSLVFTGGESNRPHAVREPRRNCRGGADNSSAQGSPTLGGGQLSFDGRCRRRER
jgi:hypothetical protein